MIFAGFYASTTEPMPFSFEQMMSYIWLGQCLFALIPFRFDSEVAAMIRSGNIAYELVRPVRLYPYWFARTVASRTAPLILRATPMILVSAGLFRLIGAGRWALGPPASLASAGVFLLSILAAMFLACAFSLIMTVSMFWTISAEGVGVLFPVVVWSLSGIVLPIPFFPEWMQRVFMALPFRGLMDVPFQIYIGSVTPGRGLVEVGVQVVWILAMVTLGRTLLRRGQQRVVVQGG
jgi:ABC-2 type transport system permease protein